MKLFIFITLLFSVNIFAADLGEHKESPSVPKTEGAVVKEDTKDLLDFNSIKDIIKTDGLEGELKKKETEKRVLLDQKNLVI